MTDLFWLGRGQRPRQQPGDPPSRNRYGATRCCAEPVRLRSSSYGATRSCAERERNVPFYQTNPPFFRDFFDATATTRGACGGNTRRISVGSSWKTNPPGGGFRGVFGRLETFITRERGTASGPLALQFGQSRAVRPTDESVFAKVAPSARIRRVSSDSASTRQGGPRNMWCRRRQRRLVGLGSCETNRIGNRWFLCGTTEASRS